MTANKWYCIAQSSTFDSSCGITIYSEGVAVSFTASVRFGSSSINIASCVINGETLLSVRLRETDYKWCVDLLCNTEMDFSIDVTDSPYWEVQNTPAGTGSILAIINDISKEFNTGTKGGESLWQLYNFGTLEKPEYAVVPKDYEGKPIGVVSKTFISFGGHNSGAGESGGTGGGGITTFNVVLNDKKYTSEGDTLTITEKLTPLNSFNTLNDKMSEIEKMLNGINNLWFIDPDNADTIRTVYNVIVEKAISFGGAGTPGSGGSGATTLSGLSDVALNALSDGQSLVYENGYWVNKKVGLDTTAVWDTLATVDATKVIDSSHIPDLSGKYLPLSGGTLSSKGDTPLVVDSTATNTYIQFLRNGALVGYFGYVGNEPYTFYSGFKKIIHSGNIGSQSVNYANNSGSVGGIIGDLTSATNEKTGYWGYLGYGSIKKLTLGSNYGGLAWTAEDYCASMMFGCPLDTHGFISIGYNNPIISFAGSNNTNASNDAPKWYWKLKGTSGTTYDLNCAPSATKLQTARTIWGQSFDGTGDVNGRIVIKDNFGLYHKTPDDEYLCYIGHDSVGSYSLFYNFRGGSSIKLNDDGSVSVPDGNVGIGINTPQYKLDVNGRTRSIKGYLLGNSTNRYCGLIPAREITNSGAEADIWLYNTAKVILYGSEVEISTNTSITGTLTTSKLLTANSGINTTTLTASGNATIGSSATHATLNIYGGLNVNVGDTILQDLTAGDTTVSSLTSTGTILADGQTISTGQGGNIWSAKGEFYDLRPTSAGYGSVGSSSERWANAYFKALDIENRADVGSLYSASNITCMGYLRARGNLYVGASDDTQNLFIYGNLTSTGSITFGSASDRRLKDNIKSMTDEQATYVLKALNPVTYQWNSTAYELGKLSGVSDGFIADEYEKLIPNSGRDIWANYRAINYERATSYLVKGWQNHETRLEKAERRIKELENELKQYRRAEYGCNN